MFADSLTSELYEDGANHQSEFGFIGFKKQTMFNHGTKILTETIFSQDVENHTFGQVLSHKKILTEKKGCSSSSEDCRETLANTTKIWQTKALANPANIYTYNEETTQINYSLEGIELSRIITNKEIDDFANVTYEKIEVKDKKFGNYVTETTQQFDNDSSSWLIGLKKFIETKKSSPGAPKTGQRTVWLS